VGGAEAEGRKSGAWFVSDGGGVDMLCVKRRRLSIIVAIYTPLGSASI